jgi:rhomboid protease GluP
MRNCWGCGKEIEKEKDVYRCPKCQDKFDNETKKYNKKVDEGKIKPYFYLGAEAFKPYLTVLIIFANTLIIALMHMDGYSHDPIEVALRFGAQYSDYVFYGEWWRLATSWFVHFGIMHYVMNMFALFLIGSSVEGEFGSFKFAIVYILSGLGGSVATLYYDNPWAVSAGASGAICGVVGFAFMYAYVKKIFVGRFDSRSLLSWIVVIQVYGFLVPDIGWVAHLGGLFTGIFIGFVAAKIKRK